MGREKTARVMKVIDHQPHAWFLLDDQGVLYLDVNCSHGAVGYSVLVALNAGETSAYADQGRAYIDDLAQDIQNSAPGAVSSVSPFKSRNLTVGRGQESKRADAEIKAWLAGQSGARC